MQTLKTLIHEIAHATLHNENRNGLYEGHKDRQTKEVEAESVAFSVCSALGLDTSDYSFRYIAGWSEAKETKLLQSSMQTIRLATHDLISKVEAVLTAMDRFEIYQVDENGKYADHIYQGLAELGNEPVIDGYQRIYMHRYQGESLEEIYSRLNINIPEGYTGHSLSQKSIHAIRRTGLSIIRDDLGGKASAQHGGHDEQVNKNHYYYQVETNQNKEKYQDYYDAIDKKMPDFLKK